MNMRSSCPARSIENNIADRRPVAILSSSIMSEILLGPIPGYEYDFLTSESYYTVVVRLQLTDTDALLKEAN